MKRVSSLVAILTLAAIGFANFECAALARNPSKRPPGESHPPGSGDPGSSNTLTLKNYQVFCQQPQGKASVDVRSMTVNGHRQAFIHAETAEASANDLQNAALYQLFKGNAAFLNFVVQNPITFQLIGGETLVIQVNYSPPNQPENSITVNYVRPDSPYVQFNTPLVSSGHGVYTIPVGAGHSAIPKGSTLQFVLFQNLSNPTCATFTSDLNNLRVNGVAVGIDMDSKSCGSSCSE